MIDLAKLGLRKQSDVDAEKNKVAVATPPAPVAKPPINLSELGLTKPAEPPKAAPAALDTPPSVPTLTQSADVVETTVQIDGPVGFSTKLTELDALITAENGISQLSLDTARSYVRAIMIELRTHPEYDGILVDKDVHNVMTYVQASTQFSENQFLVSADRKKKAAEKKAAASKWDLSSLGKPMIGVDPKLEMELKSLATLNIDGIEAKTRR